MSDDAWYEDRGGRAYEDRAPRRAVRLAIADTGEVKEWQFVWRDAAGDQVEDTALNLALDLVPDLLDAITEAKERGVSLDVTLRRDEPKGGRP